MPKYLSGRVKRTPQGSLTTDRYKFLGLDQAEPNLGDPADPLLDVPAGSQFQIVSIRENPGERYWVPIAGGVQPGAITVREEGTIIPNSNGISSITDFNFKGAAITAEGFLNVDGSPGTGVTITVAAPGTDHGVIFNNQGEFATSPYFTFDNSIGIGSVGIGTSNPTQNLHVVGNVKLDKTIYGEDNQPGATGNLLTKTATGGVKWINAGAVQSGAGGTIYQVQFHGTTGLVEGAHNLNYKNDKVGIGTSNPESILDVKGNSQFAGITTFAGDTIFDGNVSIAGTLTYEDVTNVDAIGIITARSGIDVDSGGINVDGGGLNVTGVSTFASNVAALNRIDIGTTGTAGRIRLHNGQGFAYSILNVGGNLTLRSSNGGVKADDNIGRNLFFGSPGGAFQIYHAGSSKLSTTGYGVTVKGNTETRTLNVTGISTLTDLKVTNEVESNLVPSDDNTYDLGSSLKSWNNLYVQNIEGVADINFSEVNVSGILTTKDLNVTGVATFLGNVNVGNGNFIGTIRGDGSTSILGISSVTATEYYGTGATGSTLFVPDEDENLIAGNNAGIGITAEGTGTNFSACHNLLLGCSAGRSITIGDHNIVIGCKAGECITTAHSNVLIGREVGIGLSVGSSHNVFVGRQAGKCAYGACNIHMGYLAGQCISKATNSVFIGVEAGRGPAIDATTAGCSSNNQVFVGHAAGRCYRAGTHNVVLGSGAACNSCGGSHNFFAMQYSARYHCGGNDNIAIGKCAMFCGGNHSGNGGANHNISLGVSAGYCLDSGDYNIFLGYLSGRRTTSGCSNIAIGNQAMCCNLTGNQNVALGNNALRCNSTGANNIALGQNSLRCLLSSEGNIGIGNRVGYAVTNGTNNILMGCCTARNMTRGGRNIILGCCAAYNLTDGFDNILIGCRVAAPLVDGDKQLALGYDTNYWITGNSSRDIGIGHSLPESRLDVYDNTSGTGDSSFIIRSNVSATRDKKFEVFADGDTFIKGQVGIGTGGATPDGDAKLSVEGISALTNIDQTLLIRDSNSDDAIGRGGNIGFGAYVNGTMRTLAAVGGLKSFSGNTFDGNLAFYTRRNSVSPLDERVVITNLGVMKPSATETQDLGAADKRWNTFFVKNINASGGNIVVDTYETNTLKVNGISTFVGDAEFQGNVSIGGTLTYEDVTNIDSIGIITARSGIHVLTGGIGINTTNPTTKLDIVTEDHGGTFVKFISHTSSAATGRDLNIIGPAQGDDNTPFKIQTDNSLAFTIDTTNVLNLSADKKVGIGITNPQKNLHVVTDSSDATPLLLERTAQNNVVVQYKNLTSSMFAGLGGDALGWGIDDDANIGQEPMFFVRRSSGNVGIKTNNPITDLHVYDGVPEIRLQDSDGTEQYSQWKQVGGNARLQLRNGSNNGSFIIQGFGGGTATDPFVRVGTDGSVGIGTDDPEAKLHIYDASADPYLKIGGSGRDCGIQLDAATNFTAFRTDAANRLFVNAGADSIRFSIGGSSNEKLRITSAGRVGIGTDDPQQKLHVYGSGAQLIMIQSTTTSNAQLQLKTSQRTYNLENVLGGTLQIRDGSVGQTRFSINSSGTVTVANNLDVGAGIDVTGDSTFSGNVSIGGTLTYEDVTNVDSVGIITARSGIDVTNGGITVLDDGINVTGFSTFNDDVRFADRILVGDTAFMSTQTSGVVEVADSNGGKLALRRDDTSITSNNSIAQIRAMGNDPNGNEERIGAIVNFSCPNNSTWNNQDYPTHISFSNCKDGQGTRTTSLQISAIPAKAHLVSIGNSSASNMDDYYLAIRGYERSDQGASSNRVDIGILNQSQSGSAVVGIDFRLGQASTSNSTAVRLTGGKQGGWTNTTSTRDGYFAIQTIHNAVMSEKFRIDSTGRVRIGTGDNTGGTTTEGNGGADDLTIENKAGGTTGITIRSGTTSNGNIYFSDGTSGDSEYRGIIRYNHESDNMQFRTAAVEALRIISNGNVGIGSAIPREKLDIRTGRIILDQAYQLTWANATTNRARIYGDSGDNFIVETGSSNVERLRVDGNGDVLITNTQNNEGLRVTNNQNNCAIRLRASGSTDTGGFRIDHNAPNSRLLIDRTNAAGDYSSTLIIFESDGDLLPGANGSQDLGSTSNKWDKVYANEFIGEINTVQENIITGNLLVTGISTFVGVATFSSIGIGTIPTNFVGNQLVVGDGNGSRGMTIFSDGTTGRLLFADGHTGNDRISGEVRYDHSDDSMRFFTATGERARIESDGKVGIGTDNPDTLLHLFGSTGTEKLITLTGANKRNNYIGIFQNDNLEIGADEDGQGGDSSIRFRVDGSEKVRITGIGSVGIGSDSPEQRLTVSGGHLLVRNLTDDAAKIILRDDSGSYNHYQIRNEDGAFKIRNSAIGRDDISVLSTGKVGIGTSNPSQMLTVRGNILKTRSDSGVGLIYLQQDGSYNGQIAINQNGGVTRTLLHSDGASYFNGGDVIVNDTTADGNVHPDTKLHVKGGITFRELTSATQGGLPAITQWSHSGTSQDLAIGARSSTGSVIFFTGMTGVDGDWNATDNAERLRITSTGSVNIGGDYAQTTDKFQVTGNAKINGDLIVTGVLTYDDVTNIDAIGIVTARSGVNISNGGLTVVGVSTFADDLSIDDKIIHTGDTDTAFRFPSANTISFETGGTERLRMHSSGKLIQGFTLLPSSQQSSLPATFPPTFFASAPTSYGGMDVNAAIYDSRTDAVGNGGSLAFVAVKGASGNPIVRSAIKGVVEATNSNAGSLAFYTRPASGDATEKARFDSGGRFVIGHDEALLSTTSHRFKLQVIGTDFPTSGVSQARFQNDVPGASLLLAHSRSGTKGSHTILQNNDEFGKIRFYGSDGNDFDNFGAEIRALVDGTPGNNVMPGRIEFETTAAGESQPTPRMRIGSDGKIRLGGNADTAAAYTLDLGESSSTIRLVSDNGGTAIRMGAGDSDHDFTLIRVDGATANHDGESDDSSHGFSLKYMGSRSGNENSLSLFADDQQGTQFEAITILQDGKIGIKDTTPSYELEVNGTVAATNFDSLSDRRHKTNIQVIENPIEKIKKIDGVSFNWKKTNEPSLGVIADNVLEVLPEIVSGEDTKSVNYNGLIGVLIEVVKDQQKQIDELRGLIDK